MEDYDDDFFSDDGFESLPPGTLLQLEENAYRATRPQHPPSAPGTITPNAQSTLADQSTRYDASLKPHPRLHTGLTSEYGALDVGELDAEVLDEATLLGPPSALADPLALQEVYESHQPQEPPDTVENSFLPGGMEVEEPYIPQHIYEEFNPRVQKVIERSILPWWNG